MNAIQLPRALRTQTRCLVCGFAEVETDALQDRVLVLLAECPRCDHRWTERADTALPSVSAAPAPSVRPARAA